MRIGVVVLNWNGWADTLECLESLLRCRAIGGPIVVCDNDSEDESVERLRDWAEGRLDVWVPPEAPLRGLSHPPIPRPIPIVEHDRASAGAANGVGEAESAARLVLIRTGANLGFAGGNNVGLRYLLGRADVAPRCQYKIMFGDFCQFGGVTEAGGVLIGVFTVRGCLVLPGMQGAGDFGDVVAGEIA